MKNTSELRIIPISELKAAAYSSFSFVFWQYLILEGLIFKVL